MRLAYDAHTELSSNPNFAGISRGNAIVLLEQPQYLGTTPMATEFLDYVDQRSGLLKGYGGAGEGTQPLSYGFAHRTFQEYLAGVYIVSQSLRNKLDELVQQGDFWYEAMKLGLEEKVYIGNDEQALLDTAYLKLPRDFPEDQPKQRLILWLGYLASLVKAPIIKADTSSDVGGEVFLNRLLDHLLSLLNGALPPIERAEVGQVVGKLGDPREALTTIEHMAFCFVPAGPFQMGMDDGEEEFR